jgi:hypothetical protein
MRLTGDSTPSSMGNICPDTDPDTVPFLSTMTPALVASYTTDCPTVMTTADCTDTPIGFPLPTLAPSGQFYLPGQLPDAGSDSLSDHGTLTVPISGNVITWSLARTALVATATAASSNPGNAAAATPSPNSGRAVQGLRSVVQRPAPGVTALVAAMMVLF